MAAPTFPRKPDSSELQTGREVPAGAHIAMESTGRYHALLAHLASQAGFTAYVLNARDVYFYARALGACGKTDDVDAGIIARYLAEHHAHLHPWRAASSLQQRLQDLLSRRAQVAAMPSALEQVLHDVDARDIDPAALQAAFDIFLQGLDHRVQALIACDEQLSAGCTKLRTITGIGPQTSALLVTLVAYSGLDSRPHDSGTKHGRRRLSKKGSSLLCRQMLLAGLAASHSKVLKPLYQSIRAKGFASTEVLVILGRKLLRVASAVWKGSESFNPAHLMSTDDLKKY